MSSDNNPMSPLDIEVSAREAVSQYQVTAADVDDRPSILFCCPGSVLDITSGAALSLRTILAALAKKGFRAIALQATIFDSPQGGEHVMKAGEPQKDKPIWRTFIHDVEHLIIKTGSSQRRFMTCEEEENYISLFRSELKNRRPDMIFLWGGLTLERSIMREARDAGIPVVFYLVNPGYSDLSVFKDVSVILTDTQATADLYKKRHSIDCIPVGKFINSEEVRFQGGRDPKYITFINPSFEKGVSIFMPLAKLAAKQYPEIQFLVVQSRGVWTNALKILKYQESDFPNVKVIGHQLDMRPVYGNTKAVLLPSLWHESGARVIAESQINGIPVIASNTGGSKELIGIGGVVIDISEAVAQKKTEVVITENELAQWLEVVRMMWHDESRYQDYCQAVLIEAKKHDIESNADLFIAAVAPFILSSLK